MDLDQALGQFDTVGANLARLGEVTRQYGELVPEGISFTAGSPEAAKADDLRAAFRELAAALPPIDGTRITAELMDLDEIAQTRRDAFHASLPDALIGLNREMNVAAQQVAEYRRLFRAKRRELVRERARLLIAAMDGCLAALTGRYERTGEVVADPEWTEFTSQLAELERLMEKDLPTGGRWIDLKRHVRFSQAGDVNDVIEHDWPSVRPHLEQALYGELEPLPTDIGDLGAVVATRPSGHVSVALKWDQLDAGDFERLVYNLFQGATGYENVEWSMRTNAPDRGRDIAAYRVTSDALSSVHRLRVVVQCKHWLSRSLSAPDVANEVATAKLWTSPPVDVLIIVSSGRFSADAITWIENHNSGRGLPRIEWWPESHLETLIAQRPELGREFGLR